MSVLAGIFGEQKCVWLGGRECALSLQGLHSVHPPDILTLYRLTNIIQNVPVSSQCWNVAGLWLDLSGCPKPGQSWRLAGKARPSVICKANQTGTWLKM